MVHRRFSKLCAFSMQARVSVSLSRSALAWAAVVAPCEFQVSFLLLRGLSHLELCGCGGSTPPRPILLCLLHYQDASPKIGMLVSCVFPLCMLSTRSAIT